ncbi:hypothetical protein SeMB42_g00572 [Synchytrium endobioticum]|uniref:3-oxoacyl-[acyl-carrier-protein] reductase n=1 Tax=Synchytrium endobioticum TaxID=286115 RepID=A0A507DEH2_9FUNG|nr:hypothetical protein SeLEV6574_g01147 [Synchytrium endobioticum]TPX53910.1 hypothetical protein SeMB42_g00572 [Synchytrium endobioticum]
MANEKRNTLVVGATGGLGGALSKKLIQRGDNLYASVRKNEAVDGAAKVIKNIDVSDPGAITLLAKEMNGTIIDQLYIVAGYFTKEDIDNPNWEEEVKMYKICAIAPVFIVSKLLKNNTLQPNKSKIVMITSEAGSITLRTQKEGGGLYGHHSSKAAQNMVGRLLSFDLAEKGIPIVMIHPGFLRTKLTKSVGFDQFYDEGGAVDPVEAVPPLLDLVEKLTIENSGKFMAPLGCKGVGNAEVIGPPEKLPIPLELPW